MIVFVDLEHESGRAADHGEKLLAARAWITYRLEDISGLPCMLVRYDRLSDTLLDHLDARAIFLSGNSTDPANYDATALAPLFSILRDGERPVFGFCGGMQFIARSLDTPVVALPRPGGRRSVPRLRIRILGRHAQRANTRSCGDSSPNQSCVTPIDCTSPSRRPALWASPRPTEHLSSMMVDDQRKEWSPRSFTPEYYTDEHPAVEP